MELLATIGDDTGVQKESKGMLRKCVFCSRIGIVFRLLHSKKNAPRSEGGAANNSVRYGSLSRRERKCKLDSELHCALFTTLQHLPSGFLDEANNKASNSGTMSSIQK